ncbi:unnamed protein product [Onchocerca flexuosa]|uniref:Ovule protein n=1 Tax=Onchocerca flexuosa TaxID=387005 RepID=A0A183HIA5_9BILA|nr:unnamed protein product [Onchocerca flexuosa]
MVFVMGDSRNDVKSKKIAFRRKLCVAVSDSDGSPVISFNITDNIIHPSASFFYPSVEYWKFWKGGEGVIRISYERFDKHESEGASSGGCGRSSCLKRRFSRNSQRNQVFTCFLSYTDHLMKE